MLDVHNPLRINNFSYATRELIDIHLESYFKNESEVKDAWWFDESKHTYKDHSGNRKPNRQAKIIYAILKNYKQDFLDDCAYNATVKTANLLNKKIKILNKYTHFKTISVQDENNNKAKEVFKVLLYFLKKIQKTLNNIKEKVEDAVRDELVSIAITTYYDTSELGATHGGLEDIDIDDFEVLEFSYPQMTMQASGTLYFYLQWGSNSDVRNDMGSIGSNSPLKKSLYPDKLLLTGRNYGNRQKQEKARAVIY